MADYIPSTNEWYKVDDIDKVDSPALLLYKDRVKENIRLLKSMVSDVSILRPHVKTNKMAEVCSMMLQEGITQFKCATIAEAEMLATTGAPDVLLAYQLVGPKAERFANLIKAYPAVYFACLTDNEANAKHISKVAEAHGIVMNVFIDLNIGMNRTGIVPGKALPLVAFILSLKNVKLVGLHGYDGHIRDTDTATRQQNSDEGFQQVAALHQKIAEIHQRALKMVMGGTPTFPTHAHRKNVECSPGTFIFTDWGYKHAFPDEAFDYAALVITRVISIVDEHTICTDLGHKAVAAENPLPRVHFLNAPDAVPTGQSEEHFVLRVPNASSYHTGDVLYGVPVHICPTVALYDKAYVVENKKITTQWEVVARKRTINF
ncbi:D-TA family PLP-dependent enzyme [Agriterribacter sp.]|uniref:D-TA family PLP-dependent enzyme n=1 Tax=Agriterribacter sp. TaxID=2821509 RepID=UPI002B81F6A7|nr:D-TA family PLP-dependent enzyme [Agriterribacter sp.]HTN08635.1 D-TA family PLP-dependent enzyme [Agriterribacter sp.]